MENRPSPLDEGDSTSIEVKLAPAGGGRELSARLAKIETAISRRKTIVFSYHSMQRDEVSDRKVDPYHLVFRSGQFYLIAHELPTLVVGAEAREVFGQVADQQHAIDFARRVGGELQAMGVAH